MKIIFSPSKEMNLDDLENRKNDINFEEVKDNIKFIKNVKKEDSNHIFKTKAKEIYNLHKNINVLSKPAIELYCGISFRQIDNKQNKKLKDVLILSALYGISYAFDYISFYRYDYSMKHSSFNRKSIYKQINILLEKEDVVFNLASNEFSNNIEHHNLINFNFYTKKADKLVIQSTTSKKMRGIMLNYIINLSDYCNLENNIINFNIENFIFNKELSNSKTYSFVKE